jgi:hypothetical protein
MRTPAPGSFSHQKPLALSFPKCRRKFLITLILYIAIIRFRNSLINFAKIFLKKLIFFAKSLENLIFLKPDYDNIVELYIISQY